jgi:hypothetical protein
MQETDELKDIAQNNNTYLENQESVDQFNCHSPIFSIDLIDYGLNYNPESAELLNTSQTVSDSDDLILRDDTVYTCLLFSDTWEEKPEDHFEVFRAWTTPQTDRDSSNELSSSTDSATCSGEILENE